ncbi:hypothetical protein K2173_009564 [Erythroxylum novogranatense]|uniref:Uncharacterized protein n=1 Tax=Erythroxylum novogranatense TaxID=1862640 RepID=A0AAV8U4I1_9ROSI|nr:hypothetical protein K2173_009564 [Erythroxylum novogranatense]
MEKCKSVGTPMNQKEKLQKEDGAEPTDNATHRSLVGCLMYLTATRPDIQYTVSVLSRFLHCASELHMKAAKRVLRYLKGTSSYGIKFTKSERFKLYGYSDSDWAGSVEDMKSTTGYCFAMRSACFSWYSKKQDIVALSTAEAEFIAATAAANHVIWLRKLLTDLGFNVGETELNVDNQNLLGNISKSHVSWQD